MLKSKLPNVGLTIFSQMSALALAHQAINLSQGFPNFECDPYLTERVGFYLNHGFNQYAPMAGVPELQNAIAGLVASHYQATIDPVSQVTVTSGATEAIFVAIQAVVEAGDEVIVFDPAYDSYEPAVNMAQARCVHIPLLSPHYGIDWAQVSQAITTKTKAIMINSPHNPTGMTLTADDMNELSALVQKHQLYVISDEVYEHIIFDGQAHQSVLRYPELAAASFIIGSFGKTFHVTGWKVGYCIAPAALTVEFRKIHQYVTFSTVTPMQKALADMIVNKPENISGLGAFYQQKRQLLAASLAASRFQLLPCHGTYFQLLDYSQVSTMGDVAFCQWLTKTAKIATIPLSVFYQTPPAHRVIRVCFAKDDDTLQQAGQILCQV